MEEKSKQILSDYKVSITNPNFSFEALLEIKSPITVDELQSAKNKVVNQHFIEF